MSSETKYYRNEAGDIFIVDKVQSSKVIHLKKEGDLYSRSYRCMEHLGYNKINQFQNAYIPTDSCKRTWQHKVYEVDFYSSYFKK